MGKDPPSDPTEPSVVINIEDVRKKVRDLSSLDPLAYEHSRGKHAEELGVRVGVLDAEVEKGRKKRDCPQGAIPWRLSPSGQVLQYDYGNARLALKALGLVFDYDGFRNRLRIEGEGLSVWSGELSDNAVRAIRQMVLDKFDIDPGLAHTHEAIATLCQEHIRDPVLEYLDGLQWDGQGRIDRWLETYCRAKDSVLVQAYARKWLIGAVRRARQPGCKFDTMLVAVSNEGYGKSSAAGILAGDFFCDENLLDCSRKEQAELLQGRWICELPELVGIKTPRRFEAVKSFMSRKTDRLRPAYGRHVVDWKRRCVFFGSTNEEQFLPNEPGRRRFWPVDVGPIALAELARDRDQLWAEAAVAEVTGESVELPEALWPLAAEQQNLRVEEDIVELYLEEMLENSTTKMTNEAGVLVFRIATSTIAQKLANLGVHVGPHRIAAAMRKLGWTRPEGGTLRLRIGSEEKVLKGWEKPAGS